MAIISKSEANFHDIRFMKVVKCDANGQFSIELPDAILKVLGRSSHQNVLTGGSMFEVEKQLNELRNQYTSQQKTHRDVIVLHYQDNISFSKGVNFGISARSYVETTIKQSDGKQYRTFDALCYDDERLHKDLRRGQDHRLLERDLDGKTVITLTDDHVNLLNAVAEKMILLKGALSTLRTEDGVKQVLQNKQLLIGA